jgi:hypothetical protein
MRRASCETNEMDDKFEVIEFGFFDPVRDARLARANRVVRDSRSRVVTSFVVNFKTHAPCTRKKKTPVFSEDCHDKNDHGNDGSVAKWDGGLAKAFKGN